MGFSSVAPRPSGLPAVPELAAASWSWLAPEVSARRYARLVRPERFAAGSVIAMVFPAGTPAAELVRVARAGELLEAAGVPVPRRLALDAEGGWAVYEDLGDESLARAIARRPESAPALYAEALALLPRVEAARLDTSPRPALDARRLGNELDVFARAALAVGPGLAPALHAELARLATECALLPTVTCHRDYHARNLMLHEGRLRVLDWQDALSGPAPYDRVSLAYDPYVDLADGLRDELAGEAPGTGRVAVQRLAKAIGTYADQGGAWRASIRPAARQIARLLRRDPGRWPVLLAAADVLSVAAR